MRWGALTALCLTAACSEVLTGPDEVSASAMLFQGAVEVSAPDGYCIDPSASRLRAGFVVMAACARVGSEADTLPRPDALLTVQIGATGTALVAGNEPVLAALLESPAGSDLLAATATPQSVQVLETRQTDGLVLVELERGTSAGLAGGGSPDWRGFLDLGTRSAVVSLWAFDEKSLSSTEARSLIGAVAQGLSGTNS